MYLKYKYKTHVLYLKYFKYKYFKYSPTLPVAYADKVSEHMRL